MLDLAVTNGLAFLPGEGLVTADIGVRAGRLVAVTAPGDLPAAQERIEASGLLVTPGIIDPHVHFGPHVTFEEDLEHETRAAAVGGITTLGVFVAARGSYRKVFPELKEKVEELSSTDVMFHFIIHEEEQLAELTHYAREFGVSTFKAYMAEGAFGHVDDDFLLRLFSAAAEHVPNSLVCVHAENDALMKAGRARVESERGSEATLADWAEANPDYGLEEAVQRAVDLAEVAGARLYIVHMNAAREVRRAAMLRQRCPQLWTETVSHYLSLTDEHPLGALVKRKPPLRSADDVAAIWSAVADGVVDVIGTDNVVGSTAINGTGEGIFKAKVGFTSLGTHVPVTLSEGHHRRGVSLECILEAMTERPARAFGLHPDKGTLRVGADADLTLVDPQKERTVDSSALYTWSDFSPWDGEPLRGWPVTTILRGQVISQEHEIRVEPGVGRYVAR